MSNKYRNVLINMIMTIMVYFVAANCILAYYGFDLLEKINNLLGFQITGVVYFLTAISIIFLASKKHTWLPFLGQTVLPSKLINETNNMGDTSIKIQVTPNTKVAFWSSLPSKDHNIMVDKAYSDYSNSGVVRSDNNGFAVLTFNKGTGYVVPNGRFIKPHIHYRELTEDSAMIGPVKTIYL